MTSRTRSYGTAPSVVVGIPMRVMTTTDIGSAPGRYMACSAS